VSARGRALAGVVLAALALGAGGSPPAAPRALRSGTLRLAGLSAPVRIVTDRYGIPHMRAANLPDLYLAWGYVTARDRLWQLEMTRRAARGHLWEWLGNSTLEADGGAQLLRLAERADRVWARDRHVPEVAMPLERYAAGINAYLAECRVGRAPWPPEFLRVGRRPDDWRPEDSVAALFGLGVTLDFDVPELREGAAIAAHGRAWEDARERFEGQWMYDTIPDSAAARLGAANLEAAPASGRHGPEHAARDAGGARADAALAAIGPETWRDAARALASFRPPVQDGEDRRASNEFAVGAKRSSSGAPLLANDPHLELTAPGPFHVIHLCVPGLVDAIGATVPGLPSIVSGRNRTCAWGVTALSADVVDVYADTLSDDGRRVRWRGAGADAGGWAPVREAPFDLAFTVLGLRVPIPGQVRRYTPHGPVLVFDRKRHVALSVRWAVDDEHMTLAGLTGLERSTSAAEVAKRYRSLSTPGINVVAADRAGQVIYETVGTVPERHADPGRGPLPGDGRHEWGAMIPPERMPAWNVPADGFVVNANNRPMRPGPGTAWPRFDWIHDRARRIAQRLSGDRSVTPADMASVQNDVYSSAGARAVPLLLAAADSLPARLTPRMRAALDTLRAWDFYARRGRVAPTLFRAWLSALQRRSRTEGHPGLTLAALAGRAPEALRVPKTETPERPAVAAIAGLELALAELEKRLGPDLATWNWGRAHRARFAHALSALDARERWEPPLEPVDGDGSSPASTGSTLPWGMDVTHGPAFRHVVDLAAPDSSWGVVPPYNAAGAPLTPDRNLAARWSHHTYVPFYLSWERIERVAESALDLEPAR
jgi:penicillin amidase